MTVHAGDAALSSGPRAPRFALRDAPHSRIALEDLRGRPVVLVFHVADWHPVAIDQLRLLAALAPQLEAMEAAVLGISVDGTWSHQAFAASLDLPFVLLADDEPPGAVADAYGVFDATTGRSRRALVVIDRDGRVRWCEAFPEAVNPGADGILSALEAIAGTP